MAVASCAALPGVARALHGVEDLMVNDGAIGAAQGHMHGLLPRRRAAGALLLHILRVDGVHGFAGTFTLAVMNVHFLFGLAVSHFDILQRGSDVPAFGRLTYRTGERRDLGPGWVL